MPSVNLVGREDRLERAASDASDWKLAHEAQGHGDKCDLGFACNADRRSQFPSDSIQR